MGGRVVAPHLKIDKRDAVVAKYTVRLMLWSALFVMMNSHLFLPPLVLVLITLDINRQAQIFMARAQREPKRDVTKRRVRIRPQSTSAREA